MASVPSALCVLEANARAEIGPVICTKIAALAKPVEVVFVWKMISSAPPTPSVLNSVCVETRFVRRPPSEIPAVPILTAAHLSIVVWLPDSVQPSKWDVVGRTQVVQRGSVAKASIR